MTDLSVYVTREAKIDGAENVAVSARWETGRDLLAEREANGGNQLPPGRLAEVCDALARSRSEVKYRIQFAEEFDTPEKVAKALATFHSWYGIVSKGLGKPQPQRHVPSPLPGTYPVLLVDPPWRYDFAASPARRIEANYPTMEIQELCDMHESLPVATDAVLFCWATSPKLLDALRVMEAWKFDYRTSLVWVKDKIGMGYYGRQRHELLLVGKRCSLPVPLPENRPDSVIEAPRGGHSAKPEVVYDLIERMYPEGGWCELFARQPRDGWASWGNEL